MCLLSGLMLLGHAVHVSPLCCCLAELAVCGKTIDTQSTGLLARPGGREEGGRGASFASSAPPSLPPRLPQPAARLPLGRLPHRYFSIIHAASVWYVGAIKRESERGETSLFFSSESLLHQEGGGGGGQREESGGEEEGIGNEKKPFHPFSSFLPSFLAHFPPSIHSFLSGDATDGQ